MSSGICLFIEAKLGKSSKNMGGLLKKFLKYGRIVYWTFILDYTKEHWKKEWS